MPGHWQEVPAFAGHHGPLLYRTGFELAEPVPAGAVAQLCFAGVFALARVWINGVHVGEHQGYFFPTAYDVTRHLRVGENVVMVEVDCAADGHEALIGTYGPWDGRPTGLNPGGFSGPVTLRIHRSLVPGRFTLRAAPVEGGAKVEYAHEFSATAPGEVTWQVSITPEAFDGPATTAEGTQAVRRGWNQLHARLSMPEARLWWTWDRGRPHLYRFRLEVRHGSSGESVRVERLFGVRKLDLHAGTLYLNGQRLFLRGAVQGPAGFYPAGLTPDDARRDLRLMREANLNAVRAFGHVAAPAFYEEASRLGILIWQDMPLHGQYRRTVAEEARRQAGQMVDLLHAWPAVGLWCAHAALPGGWNRGSLAHTVKAAITAADETRPCIAHPEELGGPLGDSRHGFLGWHEGKVEDLPRLLRHGRTGVVTGFGAQAFPGPELTRQLVHGDWPQLDWERLETRYGLQRRHLERHVPESLADSTGRYAAATQWYQAHLYRYVIEHLRQRKYAPCPGLFAYTFAEGAPAVGFGVLDSRRAAKPAYAALAAAMQPVTISSDWPPPAVAHGAHLALKVFLLNDTSEALAGTWSWRIEREGRSLAGGSQPAALPADSRVIPEGGVDWTVPETCPPGDVELVLTLDLAGHPICENRYAFQVTTV